jgi:hypothetical protein
MRETQMSQFYHMASPQAKDLIKAIADMVPGSKHNPKTS